LTTVLDDAGATAYNASTTQDRTEYYEVLPPAELPAALWIEADRMAYPAERIQPDTFTRERDVVKNEWRERNDNAPYGHVWSFVRSGVFGEGHPYQHSPIGRPEDLDHTSLEDARAFAARFYTPANATLVVAGDFDPAQARALVDRWFGAIPARKPPEPRRFAFPKLASDRRIVVEAGVETGRVIVAWPIPPPHARGWQEIQLAARGITGMTAYKLQVDSKVARDVDWDIDPGRLGSMLSFVIDLERGADPDDAIAALETRVEWMAKIERQAGYTWDSFVSSRTQRMTSNVLGLASLQARAERLQDYVEYFGAPDAALHELRAIQAVRSVDAATATQELLVDRPKVVVIVKPTPGAPASGRIAR
jgi:predicted Zn-dependent peptidase